MTNQDLLLKRNLNGEYAEKNLDWGSADAHWNSLNIARLLKHQKIVGKSLGEVGYGSSAFLAVLEKYDTHAGIGGLQPSVRCTVQRLGKTPSDKDMVGMSVKTMIVIVHSRGDA